MDHNEKLEFGRWLAEKFVTSEKYYKARGTKGLLKKLKTSPSTLSNLIRFGEGELPNMSRGRPGVPGLLSRQLAKKIATFLDIKDSVILGKIERLSQHGGSHSDSTPNPMKFPKPEPPSLDENEGLTNPLKNHVELIVSHMKFYDVESIVFKKEGESVSVSITGGTFVKTY